MRLIPRHRAGAPCALALVSLVAGCASGPRIELPPQAAAGEFFPTYGTSPGDSVETGQAVSRQWWTTLGDPQLDATIEDALAHNDDLDQAAARISAAEARFGTAKAAALPQVTFDGSAAPGRTLAPPRVNASSYSSTLSLVWNPDIDGRIKRGKRISAAEWRIAGYDQETLRQQIASRICDAYLRYQATLATRTNIDAAIETQTRILKVAQYRSRSGIASAVEEEQALFQLERVKATLPAVIEQASQLSNRIAVLSGRMPGHWVPDPRPLPDTFPALPRLDMPIDLLRRRADVKSAEERLLIAGERLGIARAALIPSFSLGATLSTTALSPAGLLDSMIGQLVGNIRATLFDGGARHSAIREQKAGVDEALAAWHGTTLAAVEDVENALASVRAARDTVILQTNAERSAVRANEVAKGQYQLGLINFFNLLDTEQQVTDARNQRITAQANASLALVSLYIALGGGFERLGPANAVASVAR